MRKKILLIGGNYAPELTGIGKYNGEMMEWFANNGFDTTVVTTYPYYPEWQIHLPFKGKSAWYSKQLLTHTKSQQAVIRCPHYVPAHPTGIKRFLSDLSIFFSFLGAVIILLPGKKQDFVLCVAPPFSIGLFGLLFKWLRGSKFIYHIQDLQVDAARDLNLIKSKLILNYLLIAEKFILRHSDQVSSISHGMINKIKDKLDKPVAYFPNWVNTKMFYPISGKDVFKKQFGFLPSEKIVLYSGAIGEKQGLEMIINAAENLKKYKFLRFVICGTGPYRQSLMRQVETKQLDNISFLPLQTFEMFNAFLNMADLHLVLQKANASDIVLPSKLSTILSVGGVSIVTATAKTSLYNIMTSCNMGYLIEPENQQRLDEAIVAGIQQANDERSANARKYAERYLSIDSILCCFTYEILNEDLELPRLKTKEPTAIFQKAL